MAESSLAKDALNAGGFWTRVALLPGGVHTLALWSKAYEAVDALGWEPWIKTAFWVAVYVLAAFWGFVFAQYFDIVGAGAEPPGSLSREKFDALHGSIREHRSAEDGYAQRLQKLLRWVDGFFGDAAKAPSQTAGLLRAPAALWTAPSFDKCLLLALLYPLFSVLAVWALTGLVDGPVETALLFHEAPPGQRLFSVFALTLTTYAGWRMTTASGWGGLLWGFLAFVGPLAVAVAGAGAVAVGYISVSAASRGRQGLFLASYLAATAMLCFALAAYLPGHVSTEQLRWDVAAPLLLFFGVYTLVNAPFDWASLGLTRLLLRLGLEKSEKRPLAPYAFALVDAALAAVLIAVLAVAMVLATDVFDLLAEQSGGAAARVLPPMRDYLAALKQRPLDPQFLWVYFTLFSTMLPSVANLFIAGFSFLRSLAFTRDYLLDALRPGVTTPPNLRIGPAIVLASQRAIALVLAIGAQAALAFLIIGRLMPALGLRILDLASAVAL